MRHSAQAVAARRPRGGPSVLALLLPAFVFACSSGGGDVAPENDAGSDAPAPDEGIVDSTTPDAALPDAAPDVDAAEAPIPPTYAALTDATRWSSFDTTSLAAKAKGFEGATFDGRYLYFVPYAQGASGVIARFDTTGAFDAAAAWSTFDMTSVSPAATGFAGAAFDGRHLYLAPRYGAAGVVARYDTTAPFGAVGSWATFTMTSFDASANGYVGAVFDGRYVYFVPYNDSANAYHGVLARYDTTASFGATSAWSKFDLATVSASAKGFYGGVFDGRYLYLVPWIRASGTYSGVVARYDTTASFGAASAWSTFDAATVHANSVGFVGAAFDGRHVYLVPCTNGSYIGQVTRFDVKSPPSMPDLYGGASAVKYTGSFL